MTAYSLFYSTCSVPKKINNTKICVKHDFLNSICLASTPHYNHSIFAYLSLTLSHFNYSDTLLCAPVRVCVCEWVCACVCVWERERQKTKNIKIMKAQHERTLLQLDFDSLLCSIEGRQHRRWVLCKVKCGLHLFTHYLLGNWCNVTVY